MKPAELQPLVGRKVWLYWHGWRSGTVKAAPASDTLDEPQEREPFQTRKGSAIMTTLSSAIALVEILGSDDKPLATLKVNRGGTPEELGQLLKANVPSGAQTPESLAQGITDALQASVAPGSGMTITPLNPGERYHGESYLYTLWSVPETLAHVKMAVNNTGFCGGEVYYGPADKFQVDFAYSPDYGEETGAIAESELDHNDE